MKVVTLEHICQSGIMRYHQIGILNEIQVHIVLWDNAKNMEEGLRGVNLQIYGCFTHSLQLVAHDGVLNQYSVVDLLSM